MVSRAHYFTTAPVHTALARCIALALMGYIVAPAPPALLAR